MARIAIGGWQHETNTFATIKADYEAFERADEWPPMCQGADLFNQTGGVHLPITGAIEVLSDNDHELVPLLWCSATPCAQVTRDAFEKISDQFIKLIERSLPLDGIYLDLHGAMVCEHLEDGEGALLGRIRAVVGDAMPIVVSLDLHANVTAAMVRHATVLDSYRTYPHIDMAQTGGRAAHLLQRLIASGETVFTAFYQLDFLIALNRGCSLIEPCETIYRELPEVINKDVISASFTCGFHLSDIHEVGPAVLAYGVNEVAVERAAQTIMRSVISRRSMFYQKIWPAMEGVNQAVKLLNDGARTIVLADTQDNPGGGGAGDSTGLLQALIAANVKSAVFAMISDPEVVEQAHQVGIGHTFEAMLGGKSGLPGQVPFSCRCKVLGLADGHFIATGPMYKGARMSLGNCALVEIDGVKVALSSKPVQTADQSIFRHLGVEPADMAVVGLKSSVHFRNDFTALASEILVVAAPGAVFADPATLNYRNKRPSQAAY